jgi:hypothetical protein
MSPLERAARALCELDNNPPGATMDGKPLWMDYLPEVRAVVEAIRQPSEEMVAASGIPTLRKRIDELENSALMARFNGIGREADGETADVLRGVLAEVEGDWTAMLDALLSAKLR